MNNFQTLDIRHYMVLYNAPARRHELYGDFVPIHLSVPALAEISDLGIEFDPRHWRRRIKLAERIHTAVDAVHSGYLRHSFGAEKDCVYGRVHRKLFEALAFFRRSFRRSDKDWSAIVSLAVAFEMLLTDGYARNIRQRLLRRIRKLLRGVDGSRKYTKAVGDLYEARGAIVHTGTTERVVDMQHARRAFVHAFVAIVEALPRLSRTSQAPIKELVGDAKD